MSVLEYIWACKDLNPIASNRLQMHDPHPTFIFKNNTSSATHAPAIISSFLPSLELHATLDTENQNSNKSVGAYLNTLF